MGGLGGGGRRGSLGGITLRASGGAPGAKPAERQAQGGAQGIFIAQANDQHNTPCTGNIFSDLKVSGSGGAGMRINDVSCIANVIANSIFSLNKEGGVSEAAEKLIARQNVSLN